MSLAYKVEELLALRDSVSESAVSIDKFADEDVIKEHVLRPSASASANLISRESNRSLRLPTASAVGTGASYKRPSPTPSIKRGKAEKLLKEHGSPPGIRVTAGGRIVPSDLPPLGTSRFGENTYKPQALRVTPGNVMSTQSQLNGNSAARIEVIGGQPVVFVGDRMYALPAVNTASSTMSSGDTSAKDSNIKHIPDPAILSAQCSLPGASFGPPRSGSQTPFAGLDLPTLKSQQVLKKQELRTVEQTEVLQASHQSDAWRAGMIEKKRSLIVELDSIRRQIAALDNDNTSSNQASSFEAPLGAVAGSATMPSLLPQLQQPLAQSMYTFPAANPYASMMMYPFSSYPIPDPVPFVSAPAIVPHSPGSGSRRSHAVEIKPPREETKKQAMSSLDPKSPTYEPASKSNSGQGIAPPTPSPPKRSPWREAHMSNINKHEHRALSHKPSASSIDTTDFFPTNTHEHSSTRVAPRANDGTQSFNENMAVPSTPETNWPASPWNEGLSGRSRNNEPAPKLTSWPEAFGKQPSSSSLRQGATGQPLAVMSERALAKGANASNSTLRNYMPLRPESGQRTGTEENWHLVGKGATHVPSTYQEGYQAGYDHIGMPDNPEVLRGYIEGLWHFLSDESTKRQAESSAREMYRRGTDSRTSSLRGLVAGSTPHDSAVSMTFNRVKVSNEIKENIRFRGSQAADEHREPAYSPKGSTGNVQAPNLHSMEGFQEPRQHNFSNMKFPNTAGLLPDRIMVGRHVAFPSIENEMAKKSQDEGAQCRMDSFSYGGHPRQVLGNQLQNRDHGTPLSMQRFYPTPIEVSPNEFGGGNAAAARNLARPLADNRLSGLDGAMDDLADQLNQARVQDGSPSVDQRPSEILVPAADQRSAEASTPAEVEEPTASCFKPSGGKGKQKATSSPTKPSSAAKDRTVTSPVDPQSSPKKSGEHSPAKARLEQVTNKFRRVRKDDPRTMSPEDRTKRSEKWRSRFQQLKRVEMEEIEAYAKNSRK